MVSAWSRIFPLGFEGEDGNAVEERRLYASSIYHLYNITYHTMFEHIHAIHSFLTRSTHLG